MNILQIDDNIDYSRLGDITEGFSGSDLKEACRVAALNRVHSYVSAARRQYGDDYWYESNPVLPQQHCKAENSVVCY